MAEDAVYYEAASGIGAVRCQLKRQGPLGSNACNSMNRPN
jgi:hypothetical protein